MAFTKVQVVSLLELITELVDDPEEGTWTSKRNLILAVTKEDEQYDRALEEFTSWFEVEGKA